MSSELALPGTLDATSLALPTGLTFEEWEDAGNRLRLINRACQWWWGDWLNYGERAYGEKYTQALETSEYEEKTLRTTSWVARQIGMSRRRDILSFSHHAEVASLEATEQDAWLDKAVANEWGVHELRRELREWRRPRFEPPQVLDGTFAILYADPPWRYEHVRTESRAIENQYPTMELEEIKSLTPPAAENCMLFLWATSPKLAEAMEVLEAWGFTYRTCMAWVKGETAEDPTIGMGYYARQAHELLLIAKRGELPAPEPADRPASVIVARRSRHSEKPVEFYEAIETMYPTYEGQWCELFQREPRDGWIGWGNEVK